MLFNYLEVVGVVGCFGFEFNVGYGVFGVVDFVVFFVKFYCYLLG